MNRIKTEIASAMNSADSRERQINSAFRFPESFIGFSGHFPQKKILPGVCQIQCALAAVEHARQKPVLLKEVVLAKYFSPVGPDEEISCACSDVADAGEFTFKAVISNGPVRVSELKLRVAFEG